MLLARATTNVGARRLSANAPFEVPGPGPRIAPRADQPPGPPTSLFLSYLI